MNHTKFQDSTALRFAIFTGSVVILMLILGTLFVTGIFLSNVLNMKSYFLIPFYALSLTSTFLTSVILTVAVLFGILKIHKMHFKGRIKLLVTFVLNAGFLAATGIVFNLLQLDLIDACSVMLLTLLCVFIVYFLSKIFLELTMVD